MYNLIMSNTVNPSTTTSKTCSILNNYIELIGYGEYMYVYKS